MKLSIRLIFAVVMPLYGSAQFNTIVPIGKKTSKNTALEQGKTDSILITNNDLDSVSWKLVYEQFLRDSPEMAAIKNQWKFYPPLKKIIVTSPFGMRFHPLEKKMKMHNGVDLRAYFEPVYCLANGVVKFAGYGEKEGYYVVISHGNLESIYCHLSLLKCNTGQLVAGGNLIGISGSSGLSTGPHLHFEIVWAHSKLSPIVIFKILLQRNPTNCVNGKNCL